jgi:membrane protein implicated in regulation of membrane protease activity
MFPINDALDAILLGTFLFGLLFTLGSLLLGVAGADAGHDADIGHDFGHDVGHGADHGADHGAFGHFSGLFNVSSILAFITWFGGVGYVARNGLGLWTWVAVVLGVAGGLIGASVISWFLIGFLRKNSQEMNPRDWDQIGVIGHVSSSIRPSGYGEIVYEQNGVRQVAAARADGDQAIPRNTEVVVLRVEKGVAIVEPFDSLLARGQEVRTGS